LKDLTVWSGENGRTYFYQSELPYCVSQAEFGAPGYTGPLPFFTLALLSLPLSVAVVFDTFLYFSVFLCHFCPFSVFLLLACLPAVVYSSSLSSVCLASKEEIYIEVCTGAALQTLAMYGLPLVPQGIGCVVLHAC
jgi:hypothetical protein